MSRDDVKFSYGADIKTLVGELRKVQRHTDTLANSMTARLARVGQAFTGLASMVGAVKGALTGLVDAGAAILEPAANVERLKLSFSVLLKSEVAAAEMMEKLNAYAAATPFAVNDIAESCSGLIAQTGLSGEAALDVVKKLGNVSALTGARLVDLSRVYAKAMNAGLTNEVAESFEIAGVAIRKTLAEIQGVSFQDVFKKISARELGIEHLDAVLDKLTGAGGRLAGGTERLSQTYVGLASTLKDNALQALQKFGEGVLPTVKQGMENLTAAIQATFPALEELGIMVGQALDEKIGQNVGRALEDAVLYIPEAMVHVRYAIAEMKEMADVALAVPNAFQAWKKKMEWYGVRNFAKFSLGMSGKDKLDRYADRVMAARDPKNKKDDELAQMREEYQAMAEESRKRREARMAEAAAADAAAEAEREAAAAAAAAADEARRVKLAQVEATNRAAAAAKKEKEAWEEVLKQEREYAAERRMAARESWSLSGQRRGLTRDGEKLGVSGPGEIGGRIKELGRKGGHEEEIDALRTLRGHWDTLREKVKEYKEMQRGLSVETRAAAYAALGNNVMAGKLRAEEEQRQRINELTREGMTLEKARAQAGIERKIATLEANREAAQQAQITRFSMQGVNVGNGGTSVRFGGQRDWGREQLSVQRDILRYLRSAKNDKVVATLG